MGPFSGAQITVQVSALNRSRPSLSTHFKIPFNNLSSGMRVMHRTGFRIHSVSTGSQLAARDTKEPKKVHPVPPKSESSKKPASRRRQRKNS